MTLSVIKTMRKRGMRFLIGNQKSIEVIKR